MNITVFIIRPRFSRERAATKTAHPEMIMRTCLAYL